jgi:hypothetical protein
MRSKGQSKTEFRARLELGTQQKEDEMKSFVGSAMVVMMLALVVNIGTAQETGSNRVYGSDNGTGGAGGGTEQVRVEYRMVPIYVRIPADWSGEHLEVTTRVAEDGFVRVRVMSSYAEPLRFRIQIKAVLTTGEMVAIEDRHHFEEPSKEYVLSAKLGALKTIRVVIFSWQEKEYEDEVLSHPYVVTDIPAGFGQIFAVGEVDRRETGQFFVEVRNRTAKTQTFAYRIDWHDELPAEGEVEPSQVRGKKLRVEDLRTIVLPPYGTAIIGGTAGEAKTAFVRFVQP